MTTKFPGYIEFSDSGKTCRIVHKNGSILATILCEDDNFKKCAQRAHFRRTIDWEEKKNGRSWEEIDPAVGPFIGEVLELNPEEIDFEKEEIRETEETKQS